MEPRNLNHLHLVAALESAWFPKPREEALLLQLEAWLARHPWARLTLLAHAPFARARLAVESHLQARPAHLITAGGLELHHATAGGWRRDEDYPLWLAEESGRIAGTRPVAAAIGFLEARRGAPRPLVAFGSLLQDRDLLAAADHPIAVGGLPADVALLGGPARAGRPWVGRRGLLNFLDGLTLAAPA